MVRSSNTQHAIRLSSEALIQRHNSIKQTIQSEALDNGLASKDAQRTDQRLIDSQGYHKKHQKMGKKRMILQEKLLFSKFTLTNSMRKQQVLILLKMLKVNSLTSLQRKKFCFSHCSLSK